MQIVRELAGYSMGRSDLVRRAMSKKKHEVMEKERQNFIHGIVDENGNIEVPGCVRNGISEAAANKIFDQMMDFASYAFNKSHAAAYAVVAYQTGYLMKYYPAEYIAAMLNSIMGDSEKVAFYTRFAETLGIQVLPPDINESYTRFTVSGNSIRFGMAAIKNVGINVIESIVRARREKGSFISLMDFCSKIDISAVNKRAIESLIKAGAFDSLKVYRSQLLAVYEKVLDGLGNEKKKNIEGQLNLFQDFKESLEDFNEIDVKYPVMKEFQKKYLLAMEKEMTGLYLTGHPLEEFESTLNYYTSTRTSDLLVKEGLEEDMVEGDSSKYKDGDRVILGGIISEVSKKVTKANTMMAFIRLEDMYGGIEVIIFPKVLENCKDIVNNDSIVLVKGRVSIREEEQPKIICDTLEPLTKLNSEKLYIQLEDAEDMARSLEELKGIISDYRGNVPLYIYTKKEKKSYRMIRDYWVENTSDIIELLRKKYGEENVKLKESK